MAEESDGGLAGAARALEPFADLLDEVPDEEIAALAGVSLGELRAYREELLDRALEEARARGGLFAYWVEDGRRRLLVVAPDLLEAERLARSLGLRALRADYLADVL